MARTPALVASDGVTALRRILTTDQAAAQMGSARNVTTAHPASGLTPLGLIDILRAAENGAPLRYLELAEQMEERYPHYNSVLGTRKRQVAQLPITVEAASDAEIDQAKAQLIRNWLKRDTLEDELFDIQDALGKGFSLTEIIWHLPAGGPWLPARLEHRDPRWFEFDRIDGRTPLLRGHSIGGKTRTSTPQPLPPFKYINHAGKAKSGLPIRGGLARVAAWSYLFQNFSLKSWVSFAEYYGFPIRLGKYGAGASAEDRATLLEAVRSISQDAAAIVPDSMTMEIIESSASGSAEVYQRLAEYCDKQVSKLVLGQTATTDSEGGGLGGSGKEHNDVRGDIERADAKALAATLNRDLVKPIIDFNFGYLPGGMYPQINIGREDPVDTKALMEGVTTFVSMGGRVAISVVRDKLGLPDPVEGEELLQPARTQAPQTALPAPGGPVLPENAGPAFLAASLASYGASADGWRPPSREAIAAARENPGAPRANASSVAAHDSDDIDQLVQLLTDEGWEAAMAPMIDPLRAAIAGAADYDQAIAALAPTLAKMDSTALAERLEKAAFAVRAAAVTGADGKLQGG